MTTSSPRTTRVADAADGPLVGDGRMRRVTRTRASISPRAVRMVAQPPFVNLRSAASSGDTSQNISGCNSDSQEIQRLMPPAV